MRLALPLIFLAALVSVWPFEVVGQDNSAAARADDLRLQILELQAKEASLKEQAQYLDEAMKPDNIERSLAGIGSTRPEELREQRRRQLAIERDSVQAQLDLISNSRVRLETALRDAEARAYQQSAQGTIVPADELSASTVLSRRLLGAGVAVIAVMGIVVFFLIRRVRPS